MKSNLQRKKITVHGRKSTYQRSVMVRAEKPKSFLRRHGGKIAAGIVLAAGAGYAAHRFHMRRALFSTVGTTGNHPYKEHVAATKADAQQHSSHLHMMSEQANAAVARARQAGHASGRAPLQLGEGGRYATAGKDTAHMMRATEHARLAGEHHPDSPEHTLHTRAYHAEVAEYHRSNVPQHIGIYDNAAHVSAAHAAHHQHEAQKAFPTSPAEARAGYQMRHAQFTAQATARTRPVQTPTPPAATSPAASSPTKAKATRTRKKKSA